MQQPLALWLIIVGGKTIYTIGHSTRSAQEVMALLGEADVTLVADVRAFPSSRRCPQFNRGTLSAWLATAGVEYVQMPGLGGRRLPVAGSRNAGWRESAFQGYADHMESQEFEQALIELEATATRSISAIMCAEAVWWRCHRRLIADALVVRGWRVEHLGIGDTRAVHQLAPFALVDPGGAIMYPSAQTTLLEHSGPSHGG